MKIFLSQILHWVHSFIALFVLFGCLLPYHGALIVHFFFVPGMLLHWRLNNNRCFLTDLEYRLKGISPAEVKDADGFVKSLMKIFLKKLPSPRAIHIGIRVVSLSSWGVTAYRLWLGSTFVAATVAVAH